MSRHRSVGSSFPPLGSPRLPWVDDATAGPMGLPDSRSGPAGRCRGRSARLDVSRHLQCLSMPDTLRQRGGLSMTESAVLKARSGLAAARGEVAWRWPRQRAGGVDRAAGAMLHFRGQSALCGYCDPMGAGHDPEAARILRFGLSLFRTGIEFVPWHIGACRTGTTFADGAEQ